MVIPLPRRKNTITTAWELDYQTEKFFGNTITNRKREKTLQKSKKNRTLLPFHGDYFEVLSTRGDAYALPRANRFWAFSPSATCFAMKIAFFQLENMVICNLIEQKRRISIAKSKNICNFAARILFFRQ